MAITVRSRIPKIRRGMNNNLAELLDDTARRIAQDARRRAPRGSTGRLAASIKMKPEGPWDAKVEVGVFYGHFIEFGTVKTAARPFLTPAAEAARGPLRLAARRIVR